MARIAVVMAGGSGERFWPMSTAERPKQMLNLTNPKATMLEEAFERAESLVGVGKAYLATSPEIATAVEKLGLVGSSHVFAEPARRNTLGALVWASAHLIAAHDDWRNIAVAVLTADHRIGDPERFAAVARVALGVAERQGGLVTIGISPDRPETGYGYVEADRSKAVPGHQVPAYRAHAFHEKPDAEKAARYVETGSHYWNSGMFFWTLGTFSDALARTHPEAAQTMERIVEALKKNDREGAAAAFLELPSLPIDVAVMEKADRVYVVEGDFGWDDMGAWDALSRAFPHDDTGNVLLGKATAVESSGNVVVNECAGLTVSLLGAEDLIVVVTEHEVLVVPKSRAQDVRLLARKPGSASQ